jgi:hypothetical protein
VPQTVTSTAEAFHQIELPTAKPPIFGWIQNFDMSVMDNEAPPKAWTKGGTLQESFPDANIEHFTNGKNVSVTPVAEKAGTIDANGDVDSPDTWSAESPVDLTKDPYDFGNNQWLVKFDQIWTYSGTGKPAELNYYRGVWYVYQQDDHIQRGKYNHKSPASNK